MRVAYNNISEFLSSCHKIDDLKTNLNHKKTQIFNDFATCIDEIKRAFETKLNEFVSNFDVQLLNIESSINLIKKNQMILPKINESLDAIIRNFEFISNTIAEKIHSKPKKQRYLSVHFDHKAVEQFLNVNSQSNNAGMEKTIRPKNSIELPDFVQEGQTIINTPSLLPPPLLSDPEHIEFNGESPSEMKLNDNLEDLKRKSSIFSYEELVKRPRAITKNTRPETFAKMYLADLYLRTKELYNILEIASQVKPKHM
jgi:hypothetical protein